MKGLTEEQTIDILHRYKRRIDRQDKLIGILIEGMHDVCQQLEFLTDQTLRYRMTLLRSGKPAIKKRFYKYD